MNEAYVSFEVAKLLKEKGFDWSTPKLYGKCRVYNGEPIDFDTECELKDEDKGDEITTAYMQYDMWWVKSDFDLGIPCPTQQMACRWLRKEHNIHIMPTIGCDMDRTPRIFYGVVIALFNDDGNIDYRTTDGNEYDEPEDAVEAALEYALKNLI